MKLIFGMIARELHDPAPIIAFLDNAARHCHRIERVIISVFGEVDPEVVHAIETRVPLTLLDVSQPEARIEAFVREGLTMDEAVALLRHPVIEQSGRMPYGANRNGILLEAIQAGGDVLFFADSDVSPVLLSGTPGEFTFEAADVFGSHLKALSQPMVGVSTSDYSGYYIIPPMWFEGIDLFLEGLQKEGALDFVRGSARNLGLAFDAGASRMPFVTDKVLGGNVALRLEMFRTELPFFSSAYPFMASWWLTRGEDTLLGQSIAAGSAWRAMDIDLRLFHDTFGTFPEVPEVQSDAAIKERFFVTCLGWIGRNPIVNTLSGFDAAEKSRRQIECLERSVEAAARYFGDPRFLSLPEAARAAYAHLPVMLGEYEALRHAWPKAVEIAWRLREKRGSGSGGSGDNGGINRSHERGGLQP